MGGDGSGTHCLRSPLLPGHLLQVPRASPCGIGRQLAGSGAQPQARQEEVVATDLGFEQGRSGCPYIGTDSPDSGAIGPAIRVRDMGTDTLRMQRVLGGFHHRVACKLTGRQPWKGRNGGWVSPPLEDEMTEAGLQEVENYVSRRQNTEEKYIATIPIMDMCLSEKRRPGPRVAIQWW